jgi:hypothetical protein
MKAFLLQFTYTLLERVNIVAGLIKAFPGNSSVTYTGGQQYGRSVFYVVRAATIDLYC